MNNKFTGYLNVRISEEEQRNLRDIIEACAFKDQADAVRFILKISKIMIEFMAKQDTKAVLVERHFERGEVIFAEKLTPEELADTLIYIRERIGSDRYDMLLRKAADKRRQQKRDDVWFESAKKALQNFSSGPYKYDDIVQAIVRASLQNTIPVSQPYAKTILERHLKAGNIKQIGMDKYVFPAKTAPEAES